MPDVYIGYPNGKPPNAKQAQYHASPARYRMLRGAWGSGKSTSAIIEDLTLAVEHPGSLGLVARLTYPSLRDTIKKDYESLIPPELIRREIKSEGREEYEYVNDSRTIFRCLDDPKKYGSSQFDRVNVHEADEVDERMFMTLAFGRLRGSVGPRRMTLETNPPDEDHYLYKFFEEEAAPDRFNVGLSTYDNADNLPPGYIDNLKKMPKAWQRKFLEGHWGVITDGAGVFEADFDEARHVDDLVPVRDRLVIRGFDFGFHFPACVWIQIDPMDRVMVIHEMLGKDEPLRKFARRVIEETTRLFGKDCKTEDYCDFAGNQKNDRGPTACQILANEFKIPTFARKMGINQGIEGIRWLLQNDLIKINRSCRWILKGYFGGYAIDPKTDEPVKNSIYKHLFDALRYALVPKILRARSIYEGKALPQTWRRAV